MTRRAALTGLVGLLALSGCPDPESPSSLADEIQLRVTLDLSRGEDNPTFLLSRSESRTFRSRIEGLEEQKDKAPPRPGSTGYQGIVLREVGRGDGRAEYRIKNGWVALKVGPTAKGLVDPRRALEAWVLKRGERVLPPAPYADVQRELESR